MSIVLKTQQEIEILKEGGAIHAAILRELSSAVRVGMIASELDTLARALCEQYNVTPAFLGYTPEGVSYPYPSAVCVSVNDEVVHGIPLDDVVFEEGDVVSIDIGVVHKNMITDAAVTVIVGEGDEEDRKLINITRESLLVGIKAAQPGNTVGDIGYVISEFVKPYGYGVVKILAGHGVGHSVHEDPYVPNYGNKGEGEKLVPGMVLAIEPMLTRGSDEVAATEDEYTYVTYDGSNAAHFEHTIAITENGPIILTK